MCRGCSTARSSATPVLKAFWILHVKMGVSNSICALASKTNVLFPCIMCN